MDSCNLDLPNLHTPVVNVHPLPLFTLLNHHGRREPGQDRVRGGLLGTVDKLTGVIEITDAFGVYFTLRGNKVRGSCPWDTFGWGIWHTPHTLHTHTRRPLHCLHPALHSNA